MDATSPTIETDPPAAARPWSRSWPTLIILFCLPGIAWSLASPLFSVPDEPSHVIKAVAVWQGELSTEDAIVVIPEVWGQASPYRECFAFKPTATADCAPAFAGSDAPADVFTTAGRYPPLFYSLVGWGGRVAPGPLGVHLMRLSSALVCGVLLAVSARALMRVIDPRLAVAGVLVAATPMVQFLAGSVNSNGLEVASAIAVWCVLLAILRWGDLHDEPLPRSLVVQLAIAASVMALTRPLSPAYLGAIGILVLVSVPFASVRRVLRDRSALLAGGIVALVTVLAGTYVVQNRTVSNAMGFELGDRNPLTVILGQTSVYVEGMIGTFGWLDTHPPLVTILAWLGAVFGLLALGLVLGSPRAAISLLLVFGATLVLPVAAQLPSAHANGIPWQGRYTLPLAVGIPLLAVVVIDGQHAIARHLAGRLAVGLAALTGVGSVAAFYWALRRYSTGATGSLQITSAAWQPPGGSILLVLLMVLFAVGAVAVVLASGRDRGAGRRVEALAPDVEHDEHPRHGDLARGAT